MESQQACEPIASYEEWSKFVREPLMWLGEEDPVKSMDQARADDPVRSAVVELITEWKEHLGIEKAFKSSAIIDIAKEKRPVTKTDWTGSGNLCGRTSMLC